METIVIEAHDPSAPTGHLPGFAREESYWPVVKSDCAGAEHVARVMA